MTTRKTYREGGDEAPSPYYDDGGIPAEEDELESHDGIDTMSVRKGEIPRGYIRGRWHKTRLRFAVAVPMILLMEVAMLLTSLAALWLAKQGVLLEVDVVWNLVLPLGGAVAAAAALWFARASWPTAEPSGPFRPLLYGTAVSWTIIAATFFIVGMAGIMTTTV